MRAFFNFALPKSSYINKTHTLKKHERLKGRKGVQMLFQHGKSFIISPLRVVYSVTGSDAGLQAGFSVSKKKFNKATQRNHIKRLLREAWRLNNVSLKQNLHTQQKQMLVFFIYTGSQNPKFSEVQAVMRQAVSKLNITVGCTEKK